MHDIRTLASLAHVRPPKAPRPLAGLAATLLLCAALTACGGDDTPPTAGQPGGTPTQPGQPTDTPKLKCAP
ncbi:hypothetical protein AB4120_03845 [Cupriavidus sp. 2KB_3]|uniref:hypothetical protein n=1 Tax=Cupriavidus sp. 2KB_3 TaxID=3232980 RepID=UPI003F8EC90F